MTSSSEKKPDQLPLDLELRMSGSAFGPVLSADKKVVSIQAVTKFRERGFSVDVKNGGLHLQIKTQNVGLVEFWPTTARWWIPKTKQRGYEIDGLLKLIQP